MGIKNFLKRFATAFGDAARDELSKDPGPPIDVSDADISTVNPTDVNYVSVDMHTLPPGGIIGVDPDSSE